MLLKSCRVVAFVLGTNLLAAPSYATSVLLMDRFVSGDTIFSSPLAQLTVTDAGADAVLVELQSLFVNPPCPVGRTCYGNVTNVLFNVDPSLIPSSIAVSSVTKTGSFTINNFAATTQDAQFMSGWTGGSGWDFRIDFADVDFDPSDRLSFILSAPGLTEDSFRFAQTDGYSAMAFGTWCISQDTPGFGCLNANYADVDGATASTEPVPEPASGLLLFIGLVGMGVPHLSAVAQAARSRRSARRSA